MKRQKRLGEFRFIIRVITTFWSECEQWNKGLIINKSKNQNKMELNSIYLLLQKRQRPLDSKCVNLWVDKLAEKAKRLSH